MTGYALFRLPYAQEFKLISGEVREIPSYAELSGQKGFVMAPFALSPDNPILLIQPDNRPEDGSLIPFFSENGITEPSPDLPLLASDLRNDYHIDFANFHTHLTDGDFQKLVLSRSITLERKDDVSPLALFQQACERYPRMCISLVYTPKSGLWLVATPEVLLSGRDNKWQTMALAGTMAFEENLRWSDKNIQEQRYVASYITRQLEHFTDDFTEKGPYTARAGHLAHLRSDFSFTLYNNNVVGELLQALHPTPAVCGLPKQEAFHFIIQYEHHHRSYYSGFMGPLFVNGQTHLYVTLRCMRIYRNAYRLYAGGGLLTDSIEEQEWQETETKLDTMRRILKRDKR